MMSVFPAPLKLRPYGAIQICLLLLLLLVLLIHAHMLHGTHACRSGGDNWRVFTAGGSVGASQVPAGDHANDLLRQRRTAAHCTDIGQRLEVIDL